MKTSEQINELATALSKAQGEIRGAKKDSENPFFKSKYSDLASVWEAIRVPFSDNGLSVIQATEPTEAEEVIVTTRIMHASGQWYEFTTTIPVSKSDAQGYGSALTYCRRYGLAAAAGVAQIDDDGNAAAAAKPDKPKPLPEPITAIQTARDVLNGMTPEEQDFIRTHAEAIKKLYPLGGMFAYIEQNKFDNEEKLALWCLLPSDVRTAIKKEQKEAQAA